MLSLSESILATVAFFDVMEFAPTVEEIHRFLYRGNYSLDEISNQVLHDDRYARSPRGYFTLKGSEQFCELREAKKIQTAVLMKKVHRWKWLFRLLPWVAGVAVCNNVALGNATQRSDIDLLVITKPKRLFLARAVMSVVFQLLGLRRHGTKIAGRFCLSFWIDESNLSLEDIRQSEEDPYLAFWLMSLKPVYGEKVIALFRAENIELLRSNTEDKSHEMQNLVTDNYLERWIRSYQLMRIHRKQLRLPDATGIVANNYLLKLHDNDRRKQYAALWRSRIAEVDKSRHV